MERKGEIEILNRADDDEILVRELEKKMNAAESLNNGFIANDEAIARKLQEEINLEYNQKLRKLEKLHSGGKLNISYEKYQKHKNYDDYNKEVEEEYDLEDHEWDLFEDDQLFEFDSVGGECLSTKKINIKKPPKNLSANVQSDEWVVPPMEVSNTVLNSLKCQTHSKNEHQKEKDETNLRKLQKIKRENILGFHQITNYTLNRLLKGEMPYLKKINKKIGEGKESVVYHGETPSRECALKLYKLDVVDLKLLEKNLLDDYRYRDRYSSKMSKKKLINLWAKKERDNLLLVKKCDVPCPDFITLRNNVLVMSFIGKNNIPAVKLKYANLTADMYRDAFYQLYRSMYNMYHGASLVHGDLSEDNVLWHQEKCYIIDVSQAVDRRHESAFKYLKRDCTNLAEFFNKKTDIRYLMTKEEMFKYITKVNWCQA